MHIRAPRATAHRASSRADTPQGYWVTARLQATACHRKHRWRAGSVPLGSWSGVPSKSQQFKHEQSADVEISAKVAEADKIVCIVISADPKGARRVPGCGLASHADP